MRVLFAAGRKDKLVRVRTVFNGVQVRVFEPVRCDTPGPALLWLHGGGYVAGRAHRDDTLCRLFAERLGITVVSVDYRLAPEHPYPAALDDCFDALQWIAALPDVDSNQIAVGGGSAGAGLAAALAFRARSTGGVVPVLQLLSYPMLDDRTIPDTQVERNYRGVSGRSSRIAWQAYLGGADPGIAVPARQNDLAGLPPAWIGVGTLDLFYAESVRFARRLQDAGVRCELLVVPGAFHAFNEVAPRSAVALTYFDKQCAALADAFAEHHDVPEQFVPSAQSTTRAKERNQT